MTIIIAHASREHQIVVADRLVTEVVSGKVVDDDSYKLFLYENYSQVYHFAVAFTGLARLDNQGTIDWLMDTLPDVMDLQTDIGSAILGFTSTCTQKFQSIGRIPLHQKGTTFLFCGRFNEYGSDRAHINYIPFIAIVSNCIGDKGEQKAKVSPVFHAYSLRLLKRSSHITLCRGDLASASRNTGEFIEVCRIMRKRISHQAKIRAAVNYIKLLSQKSKVISESVLGLALLNPGITAAGYDFSIRSNSLVKTIPHFVSADGNKMTNITIRFLNVDNQDCDIES